MSTQVNITPTLTPGVEASNFSNLQGNIRNLAGVAGATPLQTRPSNMQTLPRVSVNQRSPLETFAAQFQPSQQPVLSQQRESPLEQMQNVPQEVIEQFQELPAGINMEEAIVVDLGTPQQLYTFFDKYRGWSKPSNKCFLDGRYFWKVLAPYPGLVKSEMYLRIDYLKEVGEEGEEIREFESFLGLDLADVIATKGQNARYRIIKFLIDISNHPHEASGSVHSNLIYIDSEKKRVHRFEPLADHEYTEPINKMVKSFFKSILPEYEYVMNDEHPQLPRTDRCPSKGMCAAYVLKKAMQLAVKDVTDQHFEHYSDDHDLEEEKILRFASAIENEYGPIPQTVINQEDVEQAKETGIYFGLGADPYVYGGPGLIAPPPYYYPPYYGPEIVLGGYGGWGGRWGGYHGGGRRGFEGHRGFSGGHGGGRGHREYGYDNRENSEDEIEDEFGYGDEYDFDGDRYWHRRHEEWHDHWPEREERFRRRGYWDGRGVWREFGPNDFIASGAAFVGAPGGQIPTGEGYAAGMVQKEDGKIHLGYNPKGMRYNPNTGRYEMQGKREYGTQDFYQNQQNMLSSTVQDTSGAPIGQDLTPGNYEGLREYGCSMQQNGTQEYNIPYDVSQVRPPIPIEVMQPGANGMIHDNMIRQQEYGKTQADLQTFRPTAYGGTISGAVTGGATYRPGTYVQGQGYGVGMGTQGNALLGQKPLKPLYGREYGCGCSGSCHSTEYGWTPAAAQMSQNISQRQSLRSSGGQIGRRRYQGDLTDEQSLAAFGGVDQQNLGTQSLQSRLNRQREYGCGCATSCLRHTHPSAEKYSQAQAEIEEGYGTEYNDGESTKRKHRRNRPLTQEEIQNIRQQNLPARGQEYNYDTSKGTLTGAAVGAGAGLLVGGPIGAVIGGVGGGIGGHYTSKAAQQNKESAIGSATIGGTAIGATGGLLAAGPAGAVAGGIIGGVGGNVLERTGREEYGNKTSNTEYGYGQEYDLLRPSTWSPGEKVAGGAALGGLAGGLLTGSWGGALVGAGVGGVGTYALERFH